MDFVVLSSSGGTTFQAVLDRITDGTLTARCLGLVTDREDRGCVIKAEQARLPVRIVERKKGATREEYDQRLDETIRTITMCHGERSRTIDTCSFGVSPFDYAQGDTTPTLVIACIGWMWLLSPWFIEQWKTRIINVHPSLLPKYPGRHPHEEVLAAQEKESGMTIHWVDDGIDTGPIIVQKKCSVFPDDTVETLKARVQKIEKEWYPRILQMLEEKQLIVD